MMTKLELDFVRRTRFPWVVALLLLMSFTLFARQAVVWGESRERIKREDAQISELERQVNQKKHVAKAATSAQREVLAERKKNESRVLKSIHYPWNQILSTLEQSDTSKVAVLSFSHDASTGEAKITAEAAEITALGEFIAGLNNGREAGRDPIWYLANYQVQSQNSPSTILGTILQKR